VYYFCFMPSRTKFSPRTTGIAEPLNDAGQVDYFAEFEKTYIDRLSPPENNGARLLIAACGLRMVDQNFFADTIAWEDLPTNIESKEWWENQWLPLCEHLYLDPSRKPMFHDKRGFFDFMMKYFEEQKTDNENTKSWNLCDWWNYYRDKTCKFFAKLTKTPWKKEDYPEAGKWLDEFSEVMDYWGVCVRKPNFVGWWQSNKKNQDFFDISCSDVQGNNEFTRNLVVRISERVGRGDVDGAWYDVMSLEHLARHYCNESLNCINMVGMCANTDAVKGAKMILTHCHLTEEQLTNFLRDLEQLPPLKQTAASWRNGRLELFQMLQYFQNGKGHKFIDDENYSYISNHYREEFPFISKILRWISKLPIDMNIAGSRLSELFGDLGLKSLESNSHLVCNAILRKKYEKQLLQAEHRIIHNFRLKNQKIRIPLIRTRSKLLAEILFLCESSSCYVGDIDLDSRQDAYNEMLRIAIALERYKIANGNYPENLDALVPNYLDIVPLDPASGRTTFVYRQRETPQESDSPKELPYILYSLGPNNKDTGGRTYETFIEELQQDKDGTCRLEYNYVF